MRAIRVPQYGGPEAMKLEEQLVKCRLDGRGGVHHIHPPMTVEVQNYQFSAPVIQAVVEESRTLTRDWLSGLGYPPKPDSR